jgi:hypothetical protein
MPREGEAAIVGTMVLPAKPPEDDGRRWTPDRTAMLGLGAIVLVEVLKRVMASGGRASASVAASWHDRDRSSVRDVQLAEMDVLVRALTGARRRLAR